MKKLILLICVFFITACSGQKVYQQSDIIEYKNISFSIGEDIITSPNRDEDTKTYLGLSLNIHNASNTPVTLSPEKWFLEVNGEKFTNQEVVNNFKDIKTDEDRNGLVSFLITPTNKSIYLNISYDDQNFRIKLDNVI